VHAGGITFAPSYWQPASRGDTIDAAFRLDEGRILEGTLGWAARAGHGTTTGRDTPLVLADRYTCLWRDYSRVPLTNGRTSQFRYLLLITHVAEHTDSAQTHAALPRQHSLHAKAAAAPPAAPTTRPPASSAREEILAAARTLAGRSSDGSFTLMQIITSLRRAGSRYAESTIRTHEDY
jgi:hypothetical protein